jgi:hypothetical protein
VEDTAERDRTMVRRLGLLRILWYERFILPILVRTSI